MLYLNYEYYYWFKYAENIDVMVVSTQEQKEELVRKLDIYGKDEGCLKDLQDMVSFYNAGSYIRFMGYRNVAEVYENYEVFVTASLGETLGLSVMEAIGSGLAVIGLDVKYGNRLFVRPGENGYLIDFDIQYVDGDDSELVNSFSEKIVEIFKDEERLKRFHDNSYGIGKDFLQEIIRKNGKNCC